MTVGVGIPGGLLDELLPTLKVTKKNGLQVLRDLILKEIQASREDIQRHISVGIYEQDRIRRGHHIEAFQRVLEEIDYVIGQTDKKKAKRA